MHIMHNALGKTIFHRVLMRYGGHHSYHTGGYHPYHAPMHYGGGGIAHGGGNWIAHIIIDSIIRGMIYNVIRSVFGHLGIMGSILAAVIVIGVMYLIWQVFFRRSYA